MKEKRNSKDIIKRIESKKEEVKSKGVKKIGLFGSYLKGKQKKESDIDIIVEFDNLSYDNYFELNNLLERLLKKKIDLVISKSLRPELEYIKKEAKYARL